MINKKILTIGIPTYNRPEYLKECLEHICPQITDDIYVIVRDNCSSNYDVKEFIKPYVEKYHVKVYVNNTNIGGDANTARIFELCDTCWLWIIGDDDYLAPGAISQVLDTIKNQTDCIYIKFNSRYAGKVYGIEGFASAMHERGAFGYSFFTSECIYNLDITNHNMFWHYRYLSTYSSQVIRVMHDLIEDGSRSCLFLNEQVLEKHGEEISWSRVGIVPWQLTIIDEFWEQRKLFRNNIFRDIASYTMVYVDSSNLPHSKKRYLYRQIISRIGIVYLLRFNFVQIVRIPLRKVLPLSVYKRFKDILRRD